MKHQFIVFDLDGTISDPKVGIVRSMNFALAAHGFNTKSESDLVKYIGPPLDFAFSELADTDDPELLLSLVSKYRERYSTEGYAENTLYDGVVQSLECLIEKVPLAVCTSKRVDFAEKILELFDIRGLFSIVSGGDIGITKTQQLAGLLSSNQISRSSVMVGDRNVDLIGARNNHLKSVGVLWGYGDLKELQVESPDLILDNPSQLVNLVTQFCDF